MRGKRRAGGRMGLLLLGLAASLALGAGLAWTLKHRGGTQPMSGGVVVEEVRDRSRAAEAGLQPGDVLLRWERPAAPPASPEPAAGRFESGFDWEHLEVEQAPRGPVVLHGVRDGDEASFEVLPGQWGVEVGPLLHGSELALYEAGREELAAGRKDAALADWAELAARMRQAGRHRMACWILLRVARLQVDLQDWAAAEQGLEQAFAEAQAAAAPLAVAGVWRTRALLAIRRNDLSAAEHCYRQEMEISQQISREGLALASSYWDLGRIRWFRGDLREADELFRKARDWYAARAPRSLELAQYMGLIASVALKRGDPARAEQLFRESFELRESLAPGSYWVSQSLYELGAVLVEQGELEAAQGLQSRALELYERLDEPYQKVGNLVITTGALGGLILIELGRLALAREDLQQAEEFLRRAVAILERWLPGGLYLSEAQLPLGHVLLRQGRLEEAESVLTQALAIRRNYAPGALDEAEVLIRLGELEGRRERWQEAEALQRRALEIAERLAPDSFKEAEALRALGRTSLQRGGRQAALEYGLRALDALEKQVSRTGGSFEARASVSAQLAVYYQEVMELLVDEGRTAEAFFTLERSRARVLLELLAQRELALEDRTSADLLRERRALDEEHGWLQARLAMLGIEQTEQVEPLRARLAELRARRQQIAEQLRVLAPALATLEYPQPLDLPSVQTSLDPGTLLLAYSVGHQRTLLFAVEAHGPRSDGRFRVWSLPIGRQQLREEIEAFRALIELGPTSPSATERLPARGEALYRRLLLPAAGEIAEAERLLILPDGPLHALSFSTLVERIEPAVKPELPARVRYLVESKPLHVVVSATVYAELQRSRAERGDTRASRQAVIFGDPQYPEAPSSSGAERGLLDSLEQPGAERGLLDSLEQRRTCAQELRPLPGSREEARHIAGLQEDGARLYLGSEATEQRAKSLDQDASIVHFATHGCINDRFPLSSSLALSIPAAGARAMEDGLLEAWEIFERVRLDADLVTMSGCETALGQPMGGEGLIGLVRAFQYAGARSVLASLWSVSDRGTSALMKRFYEHLRAGRTKDQALRLAQLDLIQGTLAAEGERDERHPFYWGAFELIGDWR